MTDKNSQFAVIVSGGQQFLVMPGETIKVALMDAKDGDAVSFDRVLLVGGEKVQVGTPTVAGAKVTGSIVRQGRHPKVTGVKFHNKVRYRRTFGHRQDFTAIKIEKISA